MLCFGERRLAQSPSLCGEFGESVLPGHRLWGKCIASLARDRLMVTILQVTFVNYTRRFSVFSSYNIIEVLS